MRYVITVGWTLNTDDRDYVSFSDGWKEGAPQHAESFVIDDDNFELPPELVAEAVFAATNAPDDFDAGTLAAKIRSRIAASGWNGDTHDEILYGHYSLSVGDTVTVNGTRLACDHVGWRKI